MALRLPSVLTLSLSGALAFLGLWWYTSRKKGHTDEGDAKDKMAADREHLLSSASEEAAGVVGNSCSTGSGGDECAASRRWLVEREPVHNADYPEAAGLGSFPLCPPQPVERAFAGCLRGSLDTATVEPVTESSESSAEGYPETSPSSQGQQGPERDMSLKMNHQPPCDEEQVTSLCVLGDGKSDVSGMSACYKPPALESVPDSASTEEPAEEVREDPEGEVGEEKMSMPFAETRPPIDLAENLVSKDDPPDLSALEELVCDSSLLDDTGPASPSHRSLSQVTPPGQPVVIPRSPQKKDQFEECELSRSDTLEMRHLASGLITDVVTAALNQVMQEQTLLELVQSRDPCADHLSMDDSQMTHLLPKDQCSGTGSEKARSSPAVCEDVKLDCCRSGGSELAELADVDSGSSSAQSEESSSGEDLSPRVSPQPPREQAEGPGTTRMAHINGHGMENVAVSGPGVNSVDSAHSHWEHSNRASPLSQLLNTGQPNEKYNNNCSSSSQTPTVWEIEVPKHLVGRLIGKQGRYVSHLKETSGAKVFITTLPYTQEVQICHLEGSEEQVGCALELIRKKFKDLDVTNCSVRPPVAGLPSLPVTSWLMLPHRLTVEVTVVLVASGNYVFLQQHTHPTFHALRSLDQQMTLCYSHPGCPALPAPLEVGVICAAQMPEGAWWRAQVISYHEDTREVELRYVDYGGYDRVKIDTLRQIRSDFVSLPFQGSEVILENIAPLPGEEEFSAASKCALEEMTQGLAVLAQVTSCHPTGIPLVQLWRTEGEGLVSVNRALVDNGLCRWVDSP
ncbi:A-kinase anchor protein 1, mitochondrial isoform X1 [Esox lucius]|uniref:Tudor domain-containing protein n=2 Tax=Esox lucius TaxID=8010 RepID=A0A3P8Y6P4_ESOLU|nr:A-kinase anchor protein 1, mitochondrial isoform X1 [Esox lucius]XP_010899857.2 A-kinase anchor protein 1, mitochondrial isoform X1 [Esox lucius]XP_010899858.2 A-kinase anchor protein 1, mitochondrial isoform X1 [Esox lucius]